ncbi:cytochrome P450 [Ophiocordyceps sinensis CO18]|uniref:Cytochrome P450 n=1 Tax=Ophiocordyceps sinensis (strain Co18 / CGMCC 3.14243) TaxID=911162 RepID=T5APF7_OPHSC|nr:cytochrome P450 [Ophiocordyceps sinensis CO18]
MQEIHLENSSSMPVESAHLAWTAALLGVVLLPLRPIIWALQTLTPIGPLTRIIKRRLRAWAYLFDGPGIVRREFHKVTSYSTSLPKPANRDKAHGEPFEVDAPDVRMVFVSSPRHIKELDKAPDEVLSLNGAAKHMLQPLYTMNGFNWFDRRGVEGIGFVRTLRTLLTNNIPQLLPDLGLLTRTRWAESLGNKEAVNGTIHAPVYPMMMDLVVLLNARSLFGEDLIKDEKFMASALGYVEETLLNAEVVKLLPKPLAPFVGRVLSRCLSSHKTFFRSLIPATEQRLEEKRLNSSGHTIPKRADCIQWIIDTAPRQSPWSAERVIYELMAIWFGSVHILSTTIVYVIQDLCLHPEYTKLLRQELETSYAEFERTGHGLPLLDSFIKESSRLTPVESMSVRRCALKPFSLSDGTKVAPGEWACAPSGAINTSAEHYPRPEEFSGFRFVDPAELPGASAPTQPKPSKLTDVDYTFLMWGTGRMACPGRYYASAFMKVVVAQLLLNYDFTLVNPEAPRWISWRVARIPRPWTKVAFTPRT